jgi:hypothetical protein
MYDDGDDSAELLDVPDKFKKANKTGAAAAAPLSARGPAGGHAAESAALLSPTLSRARSTPADEWREARVAAFSAAHKALDTSRGAAEAVARAASDARDLRARLSHANGCGG